MKNLELNPYHSVFNGLQNLICIFLGILYSKIGFKVMGNLVEPY